MNKFINTQYASTINSLMTGYKEKLNNPYYLYADEKPCVVTYYSLNIHKSTLDEALKIQASDTGKDSAFKYNKIENFIIYGIDKITTEFDNDDDTVGLKAGTISGDAVILPNTIIPCPGDLFKIDHIKGDFLFKVLSVTPDTVENGANIYRIEYKLDKLDDDSVLDQIQDEYNMIVNNVGTNFNTIIRKNDYKLVEYLDNINIQLKKYYKALFYSDRVQTFVFPKLEYFFYDPYLIEFIIRHDVLSGDGEFIHVDHQVSLPRTFPLDYNNTFFRLFETKKVNKDYLIYSQSRLITEYLSILSTRNEDYQQIYYIKDPNVISGRFVLNNFNNELLERIKKEKYYDRNDYRNIIIKYFYNRKIDDKDIESIEMIDFEANIELFYNIPLIIFIIDEFIRFLLKKEDSSK